MYFNTDCHQPLCAILCDSLCYLHIIKEHQEDVMFTEVLTKYGLNSQKTLH